MSFTEHILVTVLTSTSVVSIFAVAVRNYLKKLIMLEFEKRERIQQHDLDKQFKISDFVLNHRIGSYLEIAQLIYELRQIIREGVEQNRGYKWNPRLESLYG